MILPKAVEIVGRHFTWSGRDSRQLEEPVFESPHDPRRGWAGLQIRKGRFQEHEMVEGGLSQRQYVPN
jgi:hypothetical protein